VAQGVCQRNPHANRPDIQRHHASIHHTMSVRAWTQDRSDINPSAHGVKVTGISKKQNQLAVEFPRWCHALN